MSPAVLIILVLFIFGSRLIFLTRKAKKAEGKKVTLLEVFGFEPEMTRATKPLVKFIFIAVVFAMIVRVWMFLMEIELN